jgi:hypothetical protein
VGDMCTVGTERTSQGDTARYALVPDLARRASLTMEGANAADRSILRVGQGAGSGLGGSDNRGIRAANVLFADAITFTLSSRLAHLVR